MNNENINPLNSSTDEANMESKIDYIERLILEIEARPLIFDKTLADYSNKLKKDANWKELSHIFSKSGKNSINHIKKIK